jgi:hypothetical protein
LESFFDPNSLFMKHLFTLLILLFLSGSLQSQTTWLRDSVYFEKGVAQTTDFQTETRSYFEEYNDDDQPIVIVSLRQNQNQEWVNWRRRSFTYENGELTQLLIQYWGPVAQTWQDWIERNFEYDADGHVLSKLVRKAPSPGDPLENLRQWTYTYNGQGNQTDRLFQTWNGSEWENQSRQIWTYNGNDQVTQQLQEVWNDGDWTNFRRRGWQYDGGTGLTSLVLEQEWSQTDEIWLNLRRKEYQNDNFGFWTGIREQSWNATDEEWENVEQEMLEYNTEFQLEGRILQTWDDNDWQNLYRMSYQFDGELFTSFGDQWDELQNDWGQFARYQVEYDSETRPLVEQGWQYWSENQQDWLNDEVSIRRIHFWSEQAVATHETTTYDQCLIPNPYQIHTPFFCEGLEGTTDYEIRLTNLVGQVILQKKGSGDQLSIDEPVPAGIYVFSLYDGTRPVHVQKLVIIQ